MLLLALVLAVLPVRAACPADAAALRADVATATGAYEDWAWADFDRSVATVRDDLGCLTEVVPGPDARAAHQLFALAGAREKDEARTVAAFRALLALEPSYEPDPVLAPQGSLLYRAWEQARASGAGSQQPLPMGAWFVDGKPGAGELPTGRSAVVQLLDPSGHLLSWYLDGGELPSGLLERLPWIAAPAPLPPGVSSAPEPVVAEAVSPPVVTEPASAPFPTAPPPAVESEGQPAVSLPAESLAIPERERGGHPSRTLLVSGLAAAVVGAGSIAAGEALENRMMDAEERPDAESLYRLGLASSFGGLALGLTGGGLVLGAVIKGSW